MDTTAMQAAPAALFWTCVVVIGPAFGVAGGWVAGMRGTPILWGVLLGICGVYGGWFLGGLVSIGMASAGMEALSRPMAIGFGLVTGVLAIRRLAAGPVLPAEAARRERRGLWVISVAALALGTYVFETERREAVAPALRALPAGATVLYEREYYGGFPADYTYDLEARMTHGQFIEWVVALELLRVEEHPETWISEGRRCMSHARFEDGVGTYSKGCH